MCKVRPSNSFRHRERAETNVGRPLHKVCKARQPPDQRACSLMTASTRYAVRQLIKVQVLLNSAQPHDAKSIWPGLCSWKRSIPLRSSSCQGLTQTFRATDPPAENVSSLGFLGGTACVGAGSGTWAGRCKSNVDGNDRHDLSRKSSHGRAVEGALRWDQTLSALDMLTKQNGCGKQAST